MTGYPDLNFPAFNYAETQLLLQGYEVVNPVTINPDPNADWYDCIVADILAMKDCDTIYMLNGWYASPGANIERWVAIKNNMKIVYESLDHWRIEGEVVPVGRA